MRASEELWTHEQRAIELPGIVGTCRGNSFYLADMITNDASFHDFLFEQREV